MSPSAPSTTWGWWTDRNNALDQTEIFMTLTRKDCEHQLPAGTDPAIVAMHLAATSEDRAASRRDAARSAVTAWLGGDPSPALIAAAISCELGGIGGPLGFGPAGGGSTARMSWASALGKGRKFATDGAAWDRALEDLLSGQRAGDATPDLVCSVAAICSGADLEWPLAFCMRRAYYWRESPDQAAPWMAAARDIAARCEPDSDAGRLAIRYGLQTLRWLYRADLTLRYAYAGGWADADAALPLVEEIAEDFSGDEVIGVDWSSPRTWTIPDGSDTALTISRCSNGHFSITISTRQAGHPACLRALHPAWVLRREDPEWAADVTAAYHTLMQMHVSVIPAILARWDAESDGNLALGSQVRVLVAPTGEIRRPDYDTTTVIGPGTVGHVSSALPDGVFDVTFLGGAGGRLFARFERADLELITDVG